MTALLQIKALDKRFGGNHAVADFETQPPRAEDWFCGRPWPPTGGLL